MRIASVLGIVAVIGCGNDSRSMAPQRYLETQLAIPGYDHDHELADHWEFVVAAMTLPPGYKLVQTNDTEFEFERGRREPWGRVSAVLPNLPDQYDELRTWEPERRELLRRTMLDATQFACTLPGYQLVRHESRTDGDVYVCSHESRSDLEVQRLYHWRDQEVLCWMLVGREFITTAARIDNAIAICDTLSVREMTPGDAQRLLPRDKQSQIESLAPDATGAASGR